AIESIGGGSGVAVLIQHRAQQANVVLTVDLHPAATPRRNNVFKARGGAGEGVRQFATKLARTGQAETEASLVIVVENAEESASRRGDIVNLTFTLPIR